MRLRSKINYMFYRIFLEYKIDKFMIRDITLYKLIILIFLYAYTPFGYNLVGGFLYGIGTDKSISVHFWGDQRQYIFPLNDN